MTSIKNTVIVLYYLTFLSATSSIATSAAISVNDFGSLWWAYGNPYYYVNSKVPSDRISPDYAGKKQVLCFNTSSYGMAIDTINLNSINLGRFNNTIPYESDITSIREAVFGLPQSELSIEVGMRGKIYRCVGRQHEFNERNFPVKFVEYGRFFQHVMISNLIMQDSSGATLNADCWLEITSWPDRLTLTFHVGGENTLPETIKLQAGELKTETITRNDKESLAILPLITDADSIEASDVTFQVPSDTEVKVSTQNNYGCLYINIFTPHWNNNSRSQDPEEHLDRMDRWPLTIKNDTDKPKTYRLLFDTPPRNITGFTSMILDEKGQPTGIPVQISKNWHNDKTRQRYEGSWTHGSTVITVPAKSTYKCQYAIAYARWGGVPAASHAQLCLIGWGHNMMWDECAVGSFGESICYEPGRTQRRGFITDVRPLMVRSNKDAHKWRWTGNVGGGDFLVYIDKDAKYVPMIQNRGRYYNYGPNLTKVIYDELSQDQSIRASYTVKLARVDDYIRVFQNIRYDILKPVEFSRLAFCQMPSDYYNDMLYNKIAIGNVNGMTYEWQVRAGSWEYDKQSIPLPGRQPWVSLHDVDQRPVVTQAARGFVVRKWNAVLGGKQCPEPYLSTYMTTAWSTNNAKVATELSPPPGMKSFQTGDFVDTDIELIVIPSQTGLYYGPSEPFIKALEKDFNTWKMIYREAAGNDLIIQMTEGRLIRSYPIEISVSETQKTQFTVSGGIGYVPLSFTDLTDYQGYKLIEVNGDKHIPVDQHVHGNDFWQTEYDTTKKTWTITYNINLDSDEKSQKIRSFIFSK